MVNDMQIMPAASKPSNTGKIEKKKNISKKSKPFLKWAGGKSQLICEIEKYYPFSENGINKYAEPFVGGGAVLFDILSKYELKEIYISDINAELINTYLTVKMYVNSLVDMLYELQKIYLSMN
ncbi:MAG: DNA adenine methylase, partial [Clostridiales bacterium]|nr:DNA adenine methylase [Clostridiales bacterium]